MSQIQTFISSIGPAGPVATLTGDLGPAVAPDGFNNINIQAIPSINGLNPERLYGLASVVTQVTDLNPLMPANTLKVEPLYDTLTTNNAVATVFPVTEIEVLASEAWVMNATVVGTLSDFSEACGGFTTGVARRGAAGGAILVGEKSLVNEDSAGFPTFGLTVVGNFMYVYAQGTAGQTWNWTCTFTLQKQLI